MVLTFVCACACMVVGGVCAWFVFVTMTWWMERESSDVVLCLLDLTEALCSVHGASGAVVRAPCRGVEGACPM